MFALGAIGKNQIRWDRPDHWESLPDLAALMGIDATMMGEYPANSNDWDALKYQLSTSHETKGKDRRPSQDRKDLREMSTGFAAMEQPKMGPYGAGTATLI